MLSRLYLLSFLVPLSTLGCTGSMQSQDSLELQLKSMQSCFDTGVGLKCISTPGTLLTASRDVDGDGSMDDFVCGDTVSASDSDSVEGGDSDSSSDDGADDGEAGLRVEGDDDDTESSESGDADSESDSDSNSDSDDDCAASDSGSASDSDSVSDLDGDGDGDGISDSTDCDCMDGGDTPDPEVPSPT